MNFVAGSFFCQFNIWGFGNNANPYIKKSVFILKYIPILQFLIEIVIFHVDVYRCFNILLGLRKFMFYLKLCLDILPSVAIQMPLSLFYEQRQMPSSHLLQFQQIMFTKFTKHTISQAANCSYDRLKINEIFT